MKIAKPVLKVKLYAVEKSVQLGSKTVQKAQMAQNILSKVGDALIFIGKIFRETFSKDFEFREFLRQCFAIGNKSFSLIAVTGFIMGIVLAIQSRPALVEFGAVSMLPGMVSISLIREIGPVITALICAGKIGSGMGAELGSMKVTEQIDAMEVSDTHPIRYLVVTRVLAATLMIPLLVLFADAMGLVGSWLGANIKGSVTIALFLPQSFAHIGFLDFLPAVIKSFVFGAAIGVVGCYSGYNAGKGTESVGRAANSAVVVSSLFVIVFDMIAAQITDMFT